ncbi:unnamed protein product [Thlaspi arvense]|uniref:Cystatin domain-containing protein n=1 Tax=Thlaspi arvense TaxID=13288 RepID=A0AAU9SML0_THLAR|nr:unnamed protein product [Thlaspi arvense]
MLGLLVICWACSIDKCVKFQRITEKRFELSSPNLELGFLMGSSGESDYEIITDPFDPRCVSACVSFYPGTEREDVKLRLNAQLERIRGKEENLPHNRTLQQEYDLINDQIVKSQGFDVDFSELRYLFDFRPAFLDDSEVAEEPETDGEFFGRLAKEAIEDYNKREGTSFEFVEVEKANIYMNSGEIYFITFVAKDHNQTKIFQAKVRNIFCSKIDHSFCRLKPGQEVEYDEDSKEVAKKPRVQY